VCVFVCEQTTSSVVNIDTVGFSTKLVFIYKTHGITPHH